MNGINYLVPMFRIGLIKKALIKFKRLSLQNEILSYRI